MPTMIENYYIILSFSYMNYFELLMTQRSLKSTSLSTWLLRSGSGYLHSFQMGLWLCMPREAQHGHSGHDIFHRSEAQHRHGRGGQPEGVRTPRSRYRARHRSALSWTSATIDRVVGGESPWPQAEEFVKITPGATGGWLYIYYTWASGTAQLSVDDVGPLGSVAPTPNPSIINYSWFTCSKWWFFYSCVHVYQNIKKNSISLRHQLFQPVSASSAQVASPRPTWWWGAAISPFSSRRPGTGLARREVREMWGKWANWVETLVQSGW